MAGAFLGSARWKTYAREETHMEPENHVGLWRKIVFQRSMPSGSMFNFPGVFQELKMDPGWFQLHIRAETLTPPLPPLPPGCWDQRGTVQCPQAKATHNRRVEVHLGDGPMGSFSVRPKQATQTCTAGGNQGVQTAGDEWCLGETPSLSAHGPQRSLPFRQLL